MRIQNAQKTVNCTRTTFTERVLHKLLTYRPARVQRLGIHILSTEIKLHNFKTKLINFLHRLSMYISFHVSKHCKYVFFFFCKYLSFSFIKSIFDLAEQKVMKRRSSLLLRNVCFILVYLAQWQVGATDYRGKN